MEHTTIKTISVVQAKAQLAEAVFVDIRDPDSYEAAHIPGAVHLDGANVDQFVAVVDKRCTLIVYCYHGITSQGGAAYFQEQGFVDVYSMDGGFCAWED